MCRAHNVGDAHTLPDPENELLALEISNRDTRGVARSQLSNARNDAGEISVATEKAHGDFRYRGLGSAN